MDSYWDPLGTGTLVPVPREQQEHLEGETLPRGQMVLAAGSFSLLLVGQGADIRAWGCPAPPCPCWHPALLPLHAWGPCLSPLSHATLSPALPCGHTQCSGTQSLKGSPDALQPPSPAPALPTVARLQGPALRTLLQAGLGV